MKHHFLSVSLLIVILVSLTGTAQAMVSPSIDPPALVYVHIDFPDDITRFATTGLPLFTRLEKGFLTSARHAEQQALQDAGLHIEVLDIELHPGTYYLAQAHPSRPIVDFASFGRVLLVTDNGALLSIDPSRVGALAQAGVELKAISLTPKPLPTTQNAALIPHAVEPDPLVQAMIDQVSTTPVYTYDKQLAGSLPVWVDGGWYTIPTRYTYSGIPIQKTMNFVGQHLQGLGMDVEYHQWSGATYPNVIGEIPGTTNPDDIYMIGAHIDDAYYGQNIPGADDNASGSVATLLAADILSKYQWGCTLRFAFWTGEEEGLLGSAAYAQRANQQGENILGYLNLDMIAWNTLNSSPGIDVIYNSSMPPTFALAQLFSDVVSAYDINLIPQLGTSLGGGSDHSSFWDYGYTSILSIEDQSDFNPYYHTPQDTPAHTDPVYFTNFVKASLAAFAHETGCLIHPDLGNLDGHVTNAINDLPIGGATVIAENNQGHAYPSDTDASGYYTRTLPADTYTVTVSANGFMSVEMDGVQVISGTTTTQDFALQPACEPVSGVDFTWLPFEPYNGDLVTFTAVGSGTLPIDFQWDFGDGITATGQTVDHAFAIADTYPVNVSAVNACGNGETSHAIVVQQKMAEFFLPLVKR